jgi:hypothetical protein
MGMAKRKYSKRSSKIEPAVQTMTVTLPIVAPGATGTYYCDLSQIASLVNRRFYRQGINWALSGIKVRSAAGALGVISISKLPNTWVMSNAWEKSMRTWNKMNREALAESQSVRPKFLDFKIYADAGHHSVGYAANLLPIDLNGTPATDGEWSASKVSIPLVSPAGAFLPGETVEREIIAVGASYPGVSAVTGFNAVSAIEGYAASRGLPNIADPNTPDDADDIGGGTAENWMSAIFNEGTDQKSDVIDDMITENTIAPYPFENDGVNTDTMYPGGANQLSTLQPHDIENITGTTIGGTTRLKGGNFPCGLMRFDFLNQAGEPQGLNIQLEFIPGTHRGYLCEPMTEM